MSYPLLGLNFSVSNNFANKTNSYPTNVSKVVDENGEPLIVYHSGNSGITAFRRAFDKTGIGRQFWGKGFYFGTIKSKDEWARRYEEKTGKKAEQYAVFLNLRNPKLGALDKTDTNFDGAILPSIKTTEGMTEPMYIAIDSNQIKSATDNNGDFSTTDNNIYHAKTDLISPAEIYAPAVANGSTDNAYGIQIVSNMKSYINTFPPQYRGNIEQLLAHDELNYTCQ